MSIGERMKQIRKEKKISVDKIASELGVSVSTVYRYEDSSIEKIPVHVFDKLCTILEVSAAELMGNEGTAISQETMHSQDVTLQDSMSSLPQEFHSPQEAMEFIVKLPMLAAYGGYDLDTMDDETIMEFANEILQQLKLVSFKYKK